MYRALSNEPQTEMSLYGLPEDILVQILQHVTGMVTYSGCIWKEGLLILSVCQRLRNIALPMVYARLGVSYNRTDNKVQGAKRPDIETNSGLIASLGYSGLVRSVDINICDIRCPSAGLRSIIDLLKNHAAEWKHVRAVGVYAVCIDPLPHVNKKEVDDVVGELRELLPRVADIKFPEASENPGVQALYKCIAQAWPEQTCRLSSNHPASMLETRQMTMLTHLKLRIGDIESCHLPVACAGSLVFLHMDKVPLCFSWLDAGSSADECRMPIEFPRLKELRVCYNASGMRRVPRMGVEKQQATVGPQLSFPALQTLHVQNIRGLCTLVQYSQLPKRLPTLELVGAVHSVDMLAKTKMPAVGRLFLSMVHVSRADNLNFLTALGQLPWRGHTYTSLGVVMHGSAKYSLDADIVCETLTRFVISAPTSISTLLAIIRQLPSLTSLKLLRLVDKNSSVADVDDLLLQHPEGMYPSAIQSLGYGCRSCDCSHDVIVRVTQHLLVKLPRLEQFLGVHVPAAPLLKFIDCHKAEHPQLGVIQCRFN